LYRNRDAPRWCGVHFGRVSFNTTPHWSIHLQSKLCNITMEY
ncbi:26958_t:CDS:1, partial [Dentiscutata erythropus]